MAKGDKDKKFWVTSPEKAALQIYDIVKKKKKSVYVSKHLAKEIAQKTFLRH